MMNKVISKASAQIKLTVPVGVLLAVISGFIYFYFPAQFSSDEYNALAQRATAVSQIIAGQLARELTPRNHKVAREIVESIKKIAGVKYAVVEDDTGGVVGSFNLDYAQELLYRTGEKSNGVVYETATPIVDGEQSIGRFYVGFSLEGLTAQVDQYRANIAKISIILFFSGLILIVGVAAMVTTPLKRIVRVAEQGAAGNLHERASALFDDEVGILGHAINSMLMNTEATLQRVDSLTRILDNRDEQLNAEIEQRRMIEKQIQLSNEIISKVSALIIVVNGNGGVDYASPSFKHVLGYEPDNILQDGWWKVVRGDGIEHMKEKNKVAKCARGEHPVSEMAYERAIVDARGNLHWILWQDTRGLNNTLIGVGQDITERKLAEEQIREQAALLDITGDAIIVRNLEHSILFWNKGAENLYGWPIADAVGKMAHELFQHESSAGIGIAYSNVIENGAWNGELKQVTKNGRVIIVESRWTLMNDEQGKPKSILVVNTDVTEQRQLEAQFRRAQRLENIGTLAGGIAHDLNNVLTPILMSIQALQRRHGDEKTQQLLSTIDLSARRGADIVKQVLTFARGTEGERILLQPRHILREIEKITKETFPKSIEIKPNLASDLWTITGDATQLHQIILNLFVNARDAMPDGGILSLKAQNVKLDEEGARRHLNAKPGNYVIFSVKDTGTGIPPEVLDKIFDPFFTTKEVGKGTGLGLSTVMSIVKSYSGFITVNSTPGQGTEFNVYVPATGEAATHQVDESRLNLPNGKGESILVVDDELSIRQITKETLEAYGYRIQTAKDGIEALTMIEKEKNAFDLVLTDMMMPNMDGGSLIRTLERLAPDIKIVAVSGITDQEVLDKIKKSRIEAFISKPIHTDSLLRILDSILHGDNAQSPSTKGRRTNGKLPDRSPASNSQNL